jgi:hypothetical protein
MIKVEMLNMMTPSGCQRLEAIMNDIHVHRTATLVDMDKMYNPKEGDYLVFIVYKQKGVKPEFDYRPSQILPPNTERNSTGDELPQFDIGSVTNE